MMFGDVDLGESLEGEVGMETSVRSIPKPSF